MARFWRILFLAVVFFHTWSCVMANGLGEHTRRNITRLRERRGGAHHLPLSRNSNSIGYNYGNIAAIEKELCTEVKKYPGKSNGAFITRDPGQWRYLVDGSMTYEVSTCTLKRFTATEARQCLSHHHLLMIGDSLMRYQFISLAYFVEHGRWPARFAMAGNGQCKHFDAHGTPTCSPPGQPSVVSENDWANVYGHDADKSWRYMHQFLGGEGMHGRMECQCARSDADRSTEVMFYERLFGANGEPINAESAVRRASTDKTVKTQIEGEREKNERDKLKLSFLSNLGSVPVHMWNRTHCERTGSCNLTALHWYALQEKANQKQWDVQGPLPEVIKDHLPHIIPDVDIALFNTGLWGGDTREIKNVLKNLFEFLHRGENANTQRTKKGPTESKRCYWKNLSPAWSTDANGYPDRFAAKDDPNRAAAYESGCGVFDVSHVTKQFASFQWMGDLGRPSCCGEKEMMTVYFDAAHFQPWVNEELNQILLNVLC